MSRGGHSQTQALSRLAATHKPCVYTAWRAQNPEPCTERIPSLLAGDGAPMKKMLAFFSWVPGKVAAGRKGGIQTQRLSRLAVSTSTMTLRRKENVETLPATDQKTRRQGLCRVAATHKPRRYPAWRPLTSPVFIPLGARKIPNLVRKESLPCLRGTGLP